jgi:TonB family protein
MVGGDISPAADVWSLGMTLVEALTQRLPVWEGSRQRELVLPGTLPAQFRELARHCLRTDVQSRWRLGDIAAHMQQWSAAPQSRTAASPGPAFSSWRYVAPMAALGLLLTAMLVGPRLFKDHSNPQRSTSTVLEQTTGRQVEALKPVTPKAGRAAQSTGGEKPSALNVVPQHLPAQSQAGSPAPSVNLVPGEVVRQVLPDVPRKARRTIKGKVRVGIRVRVDPSGSLLGAEVDSPGPSRYFAELALKAARRWKFSPAKVDGRNVSSEWILRFQFGRAATRVVPVRTAP